MTVDDLSEVVLRQRDRPGDGRPRGEDGGGGGGWWSRSASRMGAVRRPGTSYTLPQLEPVRRRCAVLVDDDDDDADEDRRATTVGGGGHGVTDLASRSPGAPCSRSTPHDCSGRDAAATNDEDDDDDNVFLDLSSDDDDAYANMVCELIIATSLRRHSQYGAVRVPPSDESD